MSTSPYKPSYPQRGRWLYRRVRPLVQVVAHACGFRASYSRYSRNRQAALQAKLRRGEPVYLLGLGPGLHNAGVALLKVTRRAGVELLFNNEAERFTGQKHFADYPALSVAELRRQLDYLGLRPSDLHAALASWDYAELVAHSFRLVAEEFPHNLPLLKPQPRDTFLTDHRAILEAYSAPRRLARQLNLPNLLPVINLRHHDNHAWFAYLASPFAHSERRDRPTLIAVIDGSGDDGSISMYVGQAGRVRLLYDNGSMFDSLGTLYTMLAATQGGWPPLSCEGRFMGAAAWGHSERYLSALRQLLHLGEGGRVFLNRNLANWPRGGYARPYTSALQAILGPPILPAEFWHPDKVLQLDDGGVTPPAHTQHKLDVAAATQRLFEIALLHLTEAFIRQTGCSQMVYAGGTALNCVANMRLLQYFDEDFYARTLQRTDTRLKLWVPPIPGDAGASVGAAYHFAGRSGVTQAEPFQHAFYCGLPPTLSEIQQALDSAPDIGYQPLPPADGPAGIARLADVLAYLIQQEAIIGLFQGQAETGPRALGHRSILANPCHAHTRQRLNQQVKYREPFRPLAPMMTFEAAQRWFQLSPGASADTFNAYNYMVLTAPARPLARQVIPAVIHHDGTGRLQIVRPSDSLTYAYLLALKRRIGVAVSVNTSLNVRSPIVQRPAQALDTLRRANALSGLVLVAESGEAFLAWSAVSQGLKDGGRQVRAWFSAWASQTANGSKLPHS